MKMVAQRCTWSVLRECANTQHVRHVPLSTPGAACGTAWRGHCKGCGLRVIVEGGPSTMEGGSIHRRAWARSPPRAGPGHRVSGRVYAVRAVGPSGFQCSPGAVVLNQALISPSLSILWPTSQFVSSVQMSPCSPNQSPTAHVLTLLGPVWLVGAHCPHEDSFLANVCQIHGVRPGAGRQASSEE